MIRERAAPRYASAQLVQLNNPLGGSLRGRDHVRAEVTVIGARCESRLYTLRLEGRRPEATAERQREKRSCQTI